MKDIIDIIDGDKYHPYKIRFGCCPEIPLEVKQWCQTTFNEERCYIGTWHIWFKTSDDLNWFILRWS